MKQAVIPGPKEPMVICSRDKIPDPPAGGLVIKVSKFCFDFNQYKIPIAS